jgi:hypothetical protein
MATSKALAGLRRGTAELFVVGSVSLVIVTRTLVSLGHALARAGEADCRVVSTDLGGQLW